MPNLFDKSRMCNSEALRWLVLHRPVGDPQRRTWGPDMQRLGDDLVKHGWVTWREGQEAHFKHRCMMEH
jgi:hypothetical protein